MTQMQLMPKKRIIWEFAVFEVPKISYPGQENDRDYSEVGLWRKAQGKEALYFSAVGFYFAEKLYQELDVPVGIINCTWGWHHLRVYSWGRNTLTDG